MGRPKKVKIQRSEAEILFDVDQVEDIPDDVKVNIKNPRSGANGLGAMVLEMYSFSSELTLNMLVVSLYRKFGINPGRGAICNAISMLIKKGVLEKTASRTYRII